MDKRESYLKLKKAEADELGVICVCKQVSERRIRKAVRNGRKRFVSVKQATEAGSSCGMCQPIVEDIINDELKKNRR
jgi:NAD(P)H-nitrite reductase large subunit